MTSNTFKCFVFYSGIILFATNISNCSNKDEPEKDNNGNNTNTNKTKLKITLAKAQRSDTGKKTNVDVKNKISSGSIEMKSSEVITIVHQVATETGMSSSAQKVTSKSENDSIIKATSKSEGSIPGGSFQDGLPYTTTITPVEGKTGTTKVIITFKETSTQKEETREITVNLK